MNDAWDERAYPGEDVLDASDGVDEVRVEDARVHDGGMAEDEDNVFDVDGVDVPDDRDEGDAGVTDA